MCKLRVCRLLFPGRRKSLRKLQSPKRDSKRRSGRVRERERQTLRSENESERRAKGNKKQFSKQNFLSCARESSSAVVVVAVAVLIYAHESRQSRIQDPLHSTTVQRYVSQVRAKLLKRISMQQAKESLTKICTAKNPWKRGRCVYYGQSCDKNMPKKYKKNENEVKK